MLGDTDVGLATFCKMSTATTGKGKGNQIDFEHSLVLPRTYSRGPSRPKHMEVGYLSKSLLF